ncbi:MAG: glutamate racemase, partial [Actinomycetota bacterium]
SGAYVRAIADTGAPVHLTSAACPGFVEFVERGQTTGDEVTVLAERLLAPIRAADVDALLLGCTHYPFLARTIGEVLGPGVTLVSSADETAFAVRATLGSLGLLRDEATIGEHRFLSSGDVDRFRELGSRLLGPELDHTEHWEPT